MMLIQSHGSGSITQVYTAIECKINVAHPVNINKHYYIKLIYHIHIDKGKIFYITLLTFVEKGGHFKV